MHTNTVHICTSIHPVLQLLLICSSPWRGPAKYEGNVPYFAKADQQNNSHWGDIMVGADGGGDYQTRAVALKSWCTYLLPSANNLSNLHFAILLWQNKPNSLQSKTSSKNQNFDAKPHFRLRTNTLPKLSYFASALTWKAPFCNCLKLSKVHKRIQLWNGKQKNWFSSFLRFLGNPTSNKLLQLQ